jgi:hypothetical protein
MRGFFASLRMTPKRGKTTAGPYGMTNKKGNGKDNSKGKGSGDVMTPDCDR